MAFRADAVEAALDRWESEGRLPPEKLTELRDEVREHTRRTSRRAVQYALASTGALILLLAAGVFGDWLWPRLDARGRSLALGAAALSVYFCGLLLGRGERKRAASYVLQTTGLLILLGTYSYSEVAWANTSVGGIVVGVLALATPLLAAPRSFLRKDPVMPAVHLALGLAFVATFLVRALGLEIDTVAWILDAILLVLTLLLAKALAGARDADEAEWALHAFVSALYAGFVLVTITGLGPLGLEENIVYPLDLWLLLIVALTLWGIHGAPPALQREWYERQLGLAVLAAIPLFMFTSMEVWDAPSEVTALLVAGMGALGLLYAIRLGARTTLLASCLAILAAAWQYGLERGGALGVVLALTASAALLFWVSTRVGWGRSVDGARARD
jgi:hypothetical protein